MDEACLLGAQLFLVPETVLKTALYWLTEYSDYRLALQEDALLPQLITSLLQQKPRLSLQASEGMTYVDAGALEYAGIIQFTGSPLLRLPIEYFKRQLCPFLLQGLGEIVAQKNSFHGRLADTLEAELSLSNYSQDFILELFYEPVLLIFSLYALHLAALVSLQKSGVDKQELAKRHLRSLRPLVEGEIKCFTGRETKKRSDSLSIALRELHRVLDTTDLSQAFTQASEAWSQCAEWSWQEIANKWSLAQTGIF
jgi:hypothetical protein